MGRSLPKSSATARRGHPGARAGGRRESGPGHDQARMLVNRDRCAEMAGCYAALAMSAVLPVVKPHRNHLGGDAFILAYPAREGRVTAICSGGKAPAQATPERYANGIPRHGGAAVAVPGLVDAWQVFHERWCSRPLPELLSVAIGYAREGFAVTRELALTLQYAGGLFTKYPSLARALHAEGNPPAFASILRVS